MNRGNATLLMVVAGAFLVLVSFGILYFVFKGIAPSVEAPPEPVGNPFSTIGSITNTRSGNELTLTLSDGSTVRVPDFTRGEQPVWVSEYEYQVAGTPTGTFLITFLEPDQDNPQGEFLVTLLAEPLGETRTAAAAALTDLLGMHNADLCKLDASVVAGPGVNEAYPPDVDLEFSGCPGAVALP